MLSETPSVIYSMFSAQALGALVTERYFPGCHSSCELRSRSWTDVYRLVVEKRAYSVRVWRHGYRAREEGEFAAHVLAALRRRGRVRAPLPRALPGGSYISDLRAPEGLRHLAVFEWTEGAAVGSTLTVEDAERAGMLLAQLHLDAPRLEVGGVQVARDARRRLALVPRVLETRGVDADQFVAAMERVLNQVEELETSRLPTGVVHGDFHQNNLLRQTDGGLAVIDFDDARHGAWLRDIASFVWALEHLGQAAASGNAFVRAYGRVRPVASEEFGYLPLFLAERDCWSILGWAVSLDVLGDPHDSLGALIRNASARFATLGAR